MGIAEIGEYMTRQLDQKIEEREQARRLETIKVLEYGLAGAIESTGGALLGLAITYDDFSVRLVLKAEFETKRFVSFHYSETMIGAILSAYGSVNRNTVHWLVDKYFKE